MARKLGFSGKVAGQGGVGKTAGVGSVGAGGVQATQRPLVMVLSSDYADDKYSSAARAKKALDRYEQENGSGSAVDYN
jgi:hypothetical protein